MGDPRRVQLTTLSSSTAGFALTSPGMAPPCGPPASSAVAAVVGHSASPAGTVRLVLTLFKSDDRSFPEFSYSELLQRETQKSHGSEGPLSRLKEEELKEQLGLSDMAKKLEEKYGGRPQMTDRIQDLIDMGDGYDNEDSFIDNSEAYDEFVPSSITTKLGGFYINSGVLQFISISSDTEPGDHMEEQPEDQPEGHPGGKRRKPSKKRKLNGANEPQKKHSNDKPPEDGPSGLSSELVGESSQKKKKKTSSLSVTNDLKRFEKECETHRLDQARASVRGLSLSISTLALGPADAAGGGCMSFTNSPLSLKTSTQDPALDSGVGDVVIISDDSSCSSLSLDPTVIEGFSSVPSAPVAPKDRLSSVPCVPSAPTDTLPTSAPTDRPLQTPPQMTAGHSGAENTVPQACPEGFPPGVEDSICRLLMATKTSDGESKVKYYTPEMNNILLEIDAQCRQHGGPLRSAVFSHLCSFLPCNKRTLLQRVNKLKNSRTEEDMEQLMKTLREAIENTMPEQKLHWKAICEANQHNVTAAEEEQEEGGMNKEPRKRFQWSEEIRESLGRLLKLKLERFQREHKGQDMDQCLRSVLDNEMKPLWPKGWMTSRILLKEARKLLCPVSMLVKKSEKMSLGETPPHDSTAERPDALTNLAHLHPPAPPPELLAAAVARYKQSVHKWGVSEGTWSPPLPPPPPQSSPIDFHHPVPPTVSPATPRFTPPPPEVTPARHPATNANIRASF